MGRILIGTASWTDKSLIEAGSFYPDKKMSAEARLRHYAGRFPAVEVDATYYGLPAARSAQLWSERTPEGFVFDVKAFRLFTGHQTPPAALPKDLREQLPPRLAGAPTVYYQDLPPEFVAELWRRFDEGLAPLRRAGRLGLVLFQFAPWFMRGRRSLEHILLCRERLAGVPLAVEFRHRSWFEGAHARQTLDFEREHGFAHVVVDEPQGSANCIPAVWQATAADAYVRLHGRNAATWNLKGLASSAQRFDYLYADEELRQLAAHIVELSSLVERVHVYFNNNQADYAVRNAADLRRLIGC